MVNKFLGIYLRSTNNWEKFAVEYGIFGLKSCIKEGIFAHGTVSKFIEFLGKILGFLHSGKNPK